MGAISTHERSSSRGARPPFAHLARFVDDELLCLHDADLAVRAGADLELPLEVLEAKLAAAEIAEEMYFKRRKEIEARYAVVL